MRTSLKPETLDTLCFLRAHLKEKQPCVHEENKPFECKLCEKKFSPKSNLNEHKAVHEEN